MLQTKVDTVKNCVMKRGNDSIAFQINKSKGLSTVTYYFGYDGWSEEKLCNIKEAQERYNKAIKNGYEVMF
jgi:hypothetical protein